MLTVIIIKGEIVLQGGSEGANKGEDWENGTENKGAGLKRDEGAGLKRDEGARLKRDEGTGLRTRERD